MAGHWLSHVARTSGRDAYGNRRPQRERRYCQLRTLARIRNGNKEKEAQLTLTVKFDFGQKRTHKDRAKMELFEVLP